MNVKEEKICRLCLNVVDNEFEIIDEISRKIFEALLLRVNLDINEDPIICKDCAEVSKRCFHFKSTLIDTEELIVSFTIGQNRAKFELKDILEDGKDTETVVENFICRFCTNRLSDSNFVLLDTLMKDATFAEMLQLLVPKMDLNIIENPIICTSCRQDLECYIKFIDNCLDIEKKVTKFCQNKGTQDTAEVKLSDIKYFLESNNYTQIHTIKKEELEDIEEACSEIYNEELLKTEETIDVKVEDLYSNEDVSETPSDHQYLHEPKQTDHFSSSILTQNNASEADIYKCSICTFDGKDKNDLICHIKLTHKDPIEMGISKTRFKCTMCAYETYKNCNFKRHMLVHKDITEVEMYKCTICTFETKYEDSLKKHMIIHKDVAEVEMFKCSMCTYQTRRKNKFKIHMLIHQDVTGVETLKCTMCAYKTYQNYNLNRHMLIHKDITEVEMYKCTICTFESKHNNSLKSHMRTHKDITEVDRYKCILCTFETRHKGNLNKHMIMHKDITEIEMYKCTMCTFEAKRKQSIKLHMLKHKDIKEVENYKCTLCTFETKHKNSWKNHMIMHKDVTEVEMYKCSMCTYQTKYRRYLKTHMLIHKDLTEVEMYKCSKCTFQARQKSNLKTHMLIHK